LKRDLGEDDLADLYRILIHEMPNVSTIASRAAEIRAAHKTGPTESLLLATTLESGATALVTSDKGFRQVKGMKVMVLDDYR
jgi:predicted nucleic acid-binding protein